MTKTRAFAAASALDTLAGFSRSDLVKEFSLACVIAQDVDTAYDILADALAQLPYTQKAITDNRRQRYECEKERPRYRTLVGDHEVLRILVLDDLELVQRRRERAQLGTNGGVLRPYVLTLVKEVLVRNSFYAAIGMAQILCDIPSPILLTLYDKAASRRAGSKDPSACTEAKQRLIKRLTERFKDTLNWRETEPPQLPLVPATPSDANVVTRLLCSFLPDASMAIDTMRPTDDDSADAYSRRLETESAADLGLMRQFLIPDEFFRLMNTTVRRRDRRDETFAEHLMVPTSSADSDAPPESDGPKDPDDQSSALDLTRLGQAVLGLARRRSRMAPGSLRITIDGVDKGPVAGRDARTILMEDGAGIVRLVGVDESDEPLTIATYILADDGSEQDRWEVELPTPGAFSCDFHRLHTGTVVVSPHLVTDASVAHPERAYWKRLLEMSLWNDASLGFVRYSRVVQSAGAGKSYFASALESLQMFRMIQERQRPLTERADAFDRLLQLTTGFWNVTADRPEETLGAFVKRIATALRRLTDPQHRLFVDLDAVTQDVLLTFFNRAHTVHTNPRAWLIIVAGRTLEKNLRDERVFLHSERLPDASLDTVRLSAFAMCSQSHHSDDGGRIFKVRRAIDRLPPMAREVMQLYSEGRSTKNISALVGVSEGAVRKRRSRAMQRLRRELRKSD